MKKVLKSIISLSLAVFVLFGLTACNKALSSTTVDDSKTVVNSVSTNGGMTVIHGDYLYFVNGTKTNDGSSSRNTTQGAICRIGYDSELKQVKKDSTVEVVVSSLVGFDEGSLFIFGDFLYYSTPSVAVNHNGKQLNGKTEFNRLDLVNGISQTLYTTYYDNTSDAVSFTYYVVGEELYLLVYEQGSAKTLKSVRICDNSYLVYEISGVESCVFSNNFGRRLDSNVVDANDFVFYTKKSTIIDDASENIVKVYKTSPNKNNSEYMGNGLETDPFKHNNVSLRAVANGKLIYSETNEYTSNTYIYAQEIKNDSKLNFSESDVIASNSYQADGEIVLFDELADGNISVVSYNAKSFQIEYWNKETNGYTPETMFSFGAKTEIKFAGISTVNEVVTDGEGNVTETAVKYLVYTVTASSKTTLYKLEISRNGELSDPQNDEIILTSDNGMVAFTGLMNPEVIANDIFFIANDSDKKAYMHVVDLSKKIEKDVNEVTFIGSK